MGATGVDDLGARLVIPPPRLFDQSREAAFFINAIMRPTETGATRRKAARCARFERSGTINSRVNRVLPR
jgi:hypothetical protein